jgi:hypothetical protein
MKEEYPYRFKTEEEFIKEFGVNWHYSPNKPNINWCYPKMNYLFGKIYPYPIVDIRFGLFKIDGWSINRYMLTEKIKKPSYKPRILDKTI